GARHESAPPRGSMEDLEVAIGGGSTDLPPRQLVGVHGQAHRAPGLAGFEARIREKLVVAALDQRLAHALRARHDQRPYARRHLALALLEQARHLLEVA